METALRWTSTALANLPDDEKRREIIDGVLFASTQPHFDQQVLSLRLGGVIDTRLFAGIPFEATEGEI